MVTHTIDVFIVILVVFLYLVEIGVFLYIELNVIIIMDIYFISSTSFDVL